MPRTVVLLGALLFAFGIPGCGEDPNDGPPGARSPGDPLTREQLSEALERAGARLPGSGSGEVPREIADAASAMKERLGGELNEMAAKAKAMSERSLTPADVESYIALISQVRGAGSDPAKVREALTAKGLTHLEWGVLSSRIAAALMASRIPPEKLEGRVGEDLATIRPFLDRLQAAGRGK